MASKALLLLPLLLLSSVVLAQQHSGDSDDGQGNNLVVDFHQLHDGGADQDDQDKTTLPDLINPFLPETPTSKQDEEKTDFETEYLGDWMVHSPNVGVSAMQLQLMPNNKAVWFDTTTLGDSAKLLDPPGNCPVSFEMGRKDCFAHAIAYDIETADIRTLKIDGDPWCSSGGLSPTGDLIGTGGNQKGIKSIRVLSQCDDCEFQERHNVLGGDRWYSTQQILEDGSMVVVGGRAAFSYDLISPNLNTKSKLFNLPFLQQTTDPAVENNLYPFVYLAPDGNVFIFANNRAILINPYTGKTVKEYPVLVGGSRNYPPSGMSALLPMKLDADPNQTVEAEVVVCGGNSPLAFGVVDQKHTNQKVFMPALQDCWRMKILDADAKWEKEDDMPTKRTMGDLLHLPTGDLLLINGAKAGTSGWEDGEDPNYTPVLYSPDKPKGQRFRELMPTTIPRMYHASSALLPDGKILVTGSNPHQYYTYDGPYPTDLRVEKFSPHYLDPKLDRERPAILEENSTTKLNYNDKFILSINVAAEYKNGLTAGDVKVTMIAPPFTTHGFSQNQRMLILALDSVTANEITAVAPANGKIAPPGFYMLFVVHRGVPSRGMWVHID